MDKYEAFRKSFALHPSMELRDGVKLMFQAEFGGGHMIADENASLLRLKEELDNTECSDTEPVFELLGESTARLNLSPVKGKLSPETLNRIFVLSANKTVGDVTEFERSLKFLYEFFDKNDLDRYLSEYKSLGYPPVSHTESYRRKYSPSYRVISEEFIKYLPIFMAIDAKKPRLLGIDGRCGSGKTTLAKLLGEVYDCNVFHADDFFLPIEMRTEERLSTPGGNMHRERLKDEVILPIKEKRTAEYRKYICSSCTFSEPVSVSERAINIVEGSYSLHPEIRDLYDLKVFLDIDKSSQLERLKIRETDESLKAFCERWIPFEERYFSQCEVEKSADVVIK